LVCEIQFFMKLTFLQLLAKYPVPLRQLFRICWILSALLCPVCLKFFLIPSLNLRVYFQVVSYPLPGVTLTTHSDQASRLKKG